MPSGDDRKTNSPRWCQETPRGTSRRENPSAVSGDRRFPPNPGRTIRLTIGTGSCIADRTRSGFTPALRCKLYQIVRGLEAAECPFANLPEVHSGRWGEGLTAEKMKECRWLRLALVAESEYVEWTPDGHLRHVSFIRLRDDKDPREVRRESWMGGA